MAFIWASPPPTTLEQAVTAALVQNESLRLEDLTVQRAAAHTTARFGAFAPTLDVSYTVGRNVTPDGAALSDVRGAPQVQGGQMQLRATARQPLLNAAATYDVLRAQKSEQAAAWRFTAQRNTVSLQCAIYYLDANYYAILARAEGERAARAAQQHSLAEQRFAAALDGADGVWVAEQQAADAARTQAQYEGRHARALASLSQYAGLDVADTHVPEPLTAGICPLGDTQAALQEQALAQRADLRAAHMTREVAQDGQIMPKLRLLPTLSGTSRAWTGTGASPEVYVGGELSWQLDAASSLVDTQDRDATYAEAAIREGALRRQVVNDVRSAWHGLQALCTAEAQAQRALAASRKHADLMLQGYAAGLPQARPQDVKMAADDLTRAQMGCAEVQRDLFVAFLTLRAVTGTALFLPGGLTP